MNEPNFETQLAALERIVRELERGDLPLEESLRLFEDGVRLARECQERLNKAERRIEVLMRDDDGKPVLETLNAKDAEPEEKPERVVKRRIVFDTDKEESAF
ncbi:MAG: exodeoxyribonuclease VII small subunit [Acidobacteriota bacterium]|nr:exodeoxyribonuclease VII small subunit [Acidobacteriota bacterium]